MRDLVPHVVDSVTPVEVLGAIVVGVAVAMQDEGFSLGSGSVKGLTDEAVNRNVNAYAVHLGAEAKVALIPPEA